MKIWDIVNELNSQFGEREEVIEGLIVAMIARQHALLIGPPGTGKSALVTELAQRFTGANYFQWLLTRFSTPEELFGPVSLKELEHGIYKRNTLGKLPQAQFSFLDEIFKANSAILNALLTIINERLFYNDGAPIQVPLMSIIGSSNEYPEEGEGLEALFDRFLLRFEVGYIAEEQAFLSMLQGGSSQAVNMTMDELFQLQMLCDAVAIPDVVYEALSKMRLELRDQGIQPSDRRFKQALSIIRAKAVLAGRRHTVIEDMNILKNSLWETPDQRDKVAKIVRYHSQDAIKTKVQDRYLELKDILQAFKANGHSTEGALEATKKIKSIMADLKTLQKDNAVREDIDQAILFTTECLSEVTNSVLGV